MPIRKGMEALPDLDQLSVAQKDDLIRELWPLRALVLKLSEQVAILTSKVAELEDRLAQNSRNPANAAEPSRARRSILSTACAPMPTMSGVS